MDDDLSLPPFLAMTDEERQQAWRGKRLKTKPRYFQGKEDKLYKAWKVHQRERQTARLKLLRERKKSEGK